MISQQNQNTNTQSPVPFQINGPTLDWTHDAGLFTHFTLWKQKCELILDCQLKHASNKWKAKTVLQWSGDHGLENTTVDALKILLMTTYKSIGITGQLITNCMLMHKCSLTYGTTWNKATSPLRIAFPEHWPTEVKNTLSCDALIFNLNNHDLMQKCIHEKTNLDCAKEIAKTDESSIAAINTLLEVTKALLKFTS